MCKICGNLTKNILINKVKYEFCEHCGFLCKTEDYILTPQDEYNRYLLHSNSENEDYLNYQKKFYCEIKEFLGKRVLDYGCGDNHILVNILKENNHEALYYDLYFYPDEKYKKCLYDAIILEEVIEHLKDPLSVVSNLIKLLNDGGKLIIRTNFIPNNVFDINWWYLRDTTHISFFDVKTFQYIGNLLSMRIIYCNEKDLVVFEKE